MIPVLLLWQFVAMALPNPVLLPTPVDVATALERMASNGEILGYATVSLKRLALGYMLAVAVGVPLGLVIGLSRTAGRLVDPVIELVRPISGIAWIPLALMLFGIGDTLAVFILFYGALFAIVLNTAAGTSEIDRHLVDAGRTYGVGRLTLLHQVILPNALPSILVGARIGMGLAWMSLIAAELIGAPNGLGFAVEYYRELLMTPKMVAVIVTLGALGYISDRLLRYLRDFMTPWVAGSKVGATAE
jgi:ABC-type nitrate/sulfonate/bicarbonate transport system permease component